MKPVLYSIPKSTGYVLCIAWLALLLPACVGPSQPTDAPSPSKVIIVLNGLWQNPDTFNGTIQSLSTTFAAEGFEVQIHKLIEVRTSERSITDQATYAFSEIQKYYSGPNYEIILIGHSQGGLRGAKILALNEEAKNPLNIKGLITLATPWKGAHITTITPARIKRLLQETSIKKILKLAGAITEIDLKSFIDDAQKQLLSPGYYPTDQPGVQDMNPENRTRSFLKDIKKSMEHNDIPVLAIAGWYKDKVTTLLPSSTLFADAEEDVICSCVRMIEKFPPSLVNQAYTRIFVGSSKHDMVVPLNSQLAKGFANKHIERHIIKGAVHDKLRGLMVPQEQVIYNHPEVIKLMVNFAKEKFTFYQL
jgi:pimeloyl-ACP methyl ester carboxylesterase